MEDRTVLVTGGSSGIGRAAATALARQGARVVVASRASEKTERAVAAIREAAPGAEVEALPLDLGCFASIRSAAEKFLAAHPRLDVLVNNAGVFPMQAGLTEDGFESQIGVNHLGHFLLTNLLLDRLRSSAPARIVTVSSMLHQIGQIDFGSFRGVEPYKPYSAYAQSKLANVLFSIELARRVREDGVTSNALHPGSVRTDITRDAGIATRAVARIFFASPEKGARTVVQLAASPDVEGVTGGYWVAGRRRTPGRRARDVGLARRLWEESAALCGI